MSGALLVRDLRFPHFCNFGRGEEVAAGAPQKHFDRRHGIIIGYDRGLVFTLGTSPFLTSTCIFIKYGV